MSYWKPHSVLVKQVVCNQVRSPVEVVASGSKRAGLSVCLYLQWERLVLLEDSLQTSFPVATHLCITENFCGCCFMEMFVSFGFCLFCFVFYRGSLANFSLLLKKNIFNLGVPGWLSGLKPLPLTRLEGMIPGSWD